MGQVVQQLSNDDIDRYFSPEKQVLFVAGLRVCYTIANYQFMVLTTLLTNGWNLALLNAVCITSIQSGLKKLLVIPTAYLANAYIGHSRMLILSALSYCAVSLLLTSFFQGMFVWNYKVNYPDPEMTEKPKMPIMWIYLSLVLITIGQCGYAYYKEREPVDFINNDSSVGEQNDKRHTTHCSDSEQEGKSKLWVKQRYSFCGNFIITFLKEVSYILMTNRFRILGTVIAIWFYYTTLDIAISLAISSAFFLIGKLCFYPFEGLEGSPLSQVFRVFLVAFKRRRYDITDGDFQYYFGNDENDADHCHLTDCIQNSKLQESHNADTDGHHHSCNVDTGYGHHNVETLPSYNVKTGEQHNHTDIANNGKIPVSYHDGRKKGEMDVDCEDGRKQPLMTQINGLTDQFRFLNKAALYKVSTDEPRSQPEDKRPCTVEQVQETKDFIRVTRLSLVFLMYGIMEAVSTTFFVEQADNMDTYVRSFNIPIQIIINSAYVSEYIVNRKLTKWFKSKKDQAASPTTLSSRFHGATRLGVGMLISVPCFTFASAVEKRRLEVLNKGKTISALWLLPQCLLLGAVRGLVVTDDFFEEEMPKSFRRSAFSSTLTEGIIGIGQILSLLLLLIVYNTTRRGAKSGWIGHDIDTSHIEYYYASMAGFGFLYSILHVGHRYTCCRRQIKGLKFTEFLSQCCWWQKYFA